MCWVEKNSSSQEIFPLLVQDSYAHLVLLRVVLSLSEHILHCPERICQVLHKIMESAVENRTFVIDLEELQLGLKKIDDIGSDLLNFDDINQCASMNIKGEQRKTWHESHGVFVIVDFLRLYYPVRSQSSLLMLASFGVNFRVSKLTAGVLC